MCSLHWCQDPGLWHHSCASCFQHGKWGGQVFLYYVSQLHLKLQYFKIKISIKLQSPLDCQAYHDDWMWVSFEAVTCLLLVVSSLPLLWHRSQNDGLVVCSWEVSPCLWLQRGENSLRSLCKWDSESNGGWKLLYPESPQRSPKDWIQCRSKKCLCIVTS